MMGVWLGVLGFRPSPVLRNVLCRYLCGEHGGLSHNCLPHFSFGQENQTAVKIVEFTGVGKRESRGDKARRRGELTSAALYVAARRAGQGPGIETRLEM